MRNPMFCLYKCENDVADQIHGNCAADQRLCLRYRDNIPNVSEPEDRFSRDAADIQL